MVTLEQYRQFYLTILNHPDPRKRKSAAFLWPSAEGVLGAEECFRLLGPRPSRAEIQKATKAAATAAYGSSPVIYPKAKIRLDCIHRGEQVELKECPTCCGKVLERIFACVVHGKCSILKDVGVKVCADCEDYSKKTAGGENEVPIR